MTTTGPPQVTPVPASIDNAGEWDAFAQQISADAGQPTQVTPDMLAGMIGSAAPLLFAADAAHDVDLLRGTFADPVIAQCQRNAGCLAGASPTAARVQLVGCQIVNGHAVLRAKLSLALQGATDGRAVETQFWDLQLGGELTVGQPTCPNCGAPIGQGELICGHCHTDVRSTVNVPVLVSRLEIY